MEELGVTAQYHRGSTAEGRKWNIERSMEVEEEEEEEEEEDLAIGK